jgi:hypothetical protein
MKHSSYAYLLFLLVGCTHLQDAPKIVHFPYASDLVEKIQKSANRIPASVSTEELSQKSPRRVYFSALYHQYLTLGLYLERSEDVKFCPQFHHDKLETDSTLTQRVTLSLARGGVKEEGKDFFPELAFNTDFSLGDYHKVIKSELETLCEEGASDNFYKFDNLVTHYSNNTSFHQDPKAMASVLKIPVFANFYLVKMLEIPGKNRTSPEELRFIRLTRTDWFESYVTEASRMRNSFLKNKMVRR